MNDVTVGALCFCFAPIGVGRVQTLILYCAMANHFCALVLFDWACDMDHESAINDLLVLLLRKCIYQNMQYVVSYKCFVLSYFISSSR